jgi:hypothetical protein
MRRRLYSESMKRRNHLVDLGTDGKIVLGLMWILRVRVCGLISPAQDRVQWRALLSKVMNLRVV